MGVLGAGFLTALFVPGLCRFFDFDPPSPVVSLSAVLLVVLAALALESGWHLTGWQRRGRRHQGGRVGLRQAAEETAEEGSRR